MGGRVFKQEYKECTGAQSHSQTVHRLTGVHMGTHMVHRSTQGYTGVHRGTQGSIGIHEGSPEKFLYVPGTQWQTVRNNFFKIIDSPKTIFFRCHYFHFICHIKKDARLALCRPFRSPSGRRTSPVPPVFRHVFLVGSRRRVRRSARPPALPTPRTQSSDA